MDLYSKLVEIVNRYGPSIFTNRHLVTERLKVNFSIDKDEYAVLERCLYDFLFFKLKNRKSIDAALFLRCKYIFEYIDMGYSPNAARSVIDTFVRLKEYVSDVELLKEMTEEKDHRFNSLLNAIKICKSGQFEQSFGMFAELARTDFAEASYCMGKSFIDGLGTEQSYEKAIAYFTKSMLGASPEGVYALGRCYEEGWGIAKNPEKAVAMYKDAASKGSQHAQALLGKYFNKGIYVDINIYESISCYKKSARQGNMESAMAIAKHYMKEGKRTGNYDDAFEWYSFLVSQGIRESYSAIAEMYADGKGTTADMGKAREFFELVKKGAGTPLSERAKIDLGVLPNIDKKLTADVAEA